MKVVNNNPKREAVLFVRIQEENKKFIEKEAKENGFSDTATYVDAVFTNIREKGKSHGNKKSSKN